MEICKSKANNMKYYYVSLSLIFYDLLRLYHNTDEFKCEIP